MKNIFKSLLLISVLGFLAFGCRTISTDVHTGPAQLKLPATFAWAPELTGIIGESSADPKILKALVVDHVEKHMAQEKIPKVAAAKADILVDYTANLSVASEEMPLGHNTDHPTSLVTWSEKGGLKREVGKGMELHFFEVGTLVITISDRKSGESIWVGTAVLEIDPKDSLEKRKAATRRALHAILKRFP